MLAQQRHDSLDAAQKALAARRSVSIFSRRGIESIDLSDNPVMRGFPPALAALDNPSPRRTKTRPEIASSLRTATKAAEPTTPRKSSIKPKKSKGTIINAVPAATPATPAILSPDTFSRTKLKESSPLEFACTTATFEITTLKETQATIIAEKRESGHRKRSSKSKYSKDRIGVWVDGVIQWDVSDHAQQEVELQRSLRPRALSDASGHKRKPSLTVIIPKTKSLSREQSIATLKRPASAAPATFHRRPSSAPKNSYPQREVSPLGTDVSLGSKQGSLRAMTVFSPLDNSRATSSASQRQDPSRSSSTASSSAPKDDNSCYSKRSSTTSVDGHTNKRSQTRHKLSASCAFSITNPTVAGVLEEYTPITKSYMDKPLPPVPHIASIMRLNPNPPRMSPPNTPRPQTARGLKSPGFGLLKKAHSPELRHTKSMTRLDRFDHEFMKTSPYVPDEESHSPTLSQAEVDLQEQLGRLSQHISQMGSASRQVQHVHTMDSADRHTSTSHNADQSPQRIASAPPTGGLRICNVTLPAPSLVIEADRRYSDSSLQDPPSRCPTIPKKSRKRDWTSSEGSAIEMPQPLARRLSDPSLFSPTHDAPPSDWWSSHRLSRAVSSPTLSKLHGADLIPRPPLPHIVDDGLIVVSGPVVMRPGLARSASQRASQGTAEDVLLKILASLNSLDDLLNTIVINKGMHRVYKENRMRLIKTVARNESPPACELREWLRPSRKSAVVDSDDLDDDVASVKIEQSPASYVQAWKRDLKVIDNLKTCILAQCQSFIRKDTVAALSEVNTPSQRVTDAFWRIWTFCAIFGCQKGRDEDLTGQLDWLKGGRLANNLDCAATVQTNFDFDAGSILLNAPEYFGRGNGEGLTADQLYDITEIWTCMAALLQGYLGRVSAAREHGIYDNCNIEEGDVEKEEYMLEEWIAWILTLGPTVVLELAEYATDSSSAGFALAQERGWTKWAPPQLITSRVTFLKEPVARLYEERVTAANTKAQTVREQAEKEKSRKRIADYALEIKMRRQDSAFKRVPLVDMSMERPMSIMSTLSGGPILTPRFPPKMSLPPIPAAIHPALRSAPAISPASAQMLQQTMMMTPPLPSASMSPPLLSHHLSPDADGASRAALRQFGGHAESTSDFAVQRIMGMGFSREDAVQALRTTDTGDGLRVDRAVDWLLRSRSPPTMWQRP